MSPEAEELLVLNLSDHVLLRNLPPTLADLMRVAGKEVMLLIADTHGGKKLSISGRVDRGWHGQQPALVSLVGQEAAKKIIDHYTLGIQAHTYIEIPNSLFGVTLKRLKALSMLESGASYSQVANKTRVSNKTIQNWRKRYLAAS